MSVYPAGVDVARYAELSPCGTYRYLLWRAWGPGRPAVFIGLNPSTADAEVDDPTVRRCVGFARRFGAGKVELVNLFAYRATDPADLRTAAVCGRGIVGPENDEYLRASLEHADFVVAAWGGTTVRGAEVARVRRVLELAREAGRFLHRLGPPTKSRAPRHPLYVPKCVTLEPYA